MHLPTITHASSTDDLLNPTSSRSAHDSHTRHNYCLHWFSNIDKHSYELFPGERSKQAALLASDGSHSGVPEISSEGSANGGVDNVDGLQPLLPDEKSLSMMDIGMYERTMSAARVE